MKNKENKDKNKLLKSLLQSNIELINENKEIKAKLQKTQIKLYSIKMKENKEVKQKTRKELITQSDFAVKCGVVRKTIYNWLLTIYLNPDNADKIISRICSKNPYLRDNGIIYFEGKSYDEANKIKGIELTILIKE